MSRTKQKSRRRSIRKSTRKKRSYRKRSTRRNSYKKRIFSRSRKRITRRRRIRSKKRYIRKNSYRKRSVRRKTVRKKNRSRRRSYQRRYKKINLIGGSIDANRENFVTAMDTQGGDSYTKYKETLEKAGRRMNVAATFLGAGAGIGVGNYLGAIPKGSPFYKFALAAGLGGAGVLFLSNQLKKRILHKYNKEEKEIRKLLFFIDNMSVLKPDNPASSVKLIGEAINLFATGSKTGLTDMATAKDKDGERIDQKLDKEARGVLGLVSEKMVETEGMSFTFITGVDYGKQYTLHCVFESDKLKQMKGKTPEDLHQLIFGEAPQNQGKFEYDLTRDKIGHFLNDENLGNQGGIVTFTRLDEPVSLCQSFINMCIEPSDESNNHWEILVQIEKGTEDPTIQLTHLSNFMGAEIENMKELTEILPPDQINKIYTAVKAKINLTSGTTSMETIAEEQTHLLDTFKKQKAVVDANFFEMREKVKTLNDSIMKYLNISQQAEEAVTNKMTRQSITKALYAIGFIGIAGLYICAGVSTVTGIFATGPLALGVAILGGGGALFRARRAKHRMQFIIDLVTSLHKIAEKDLKNASGILNKIGLFVGKCFYVMYVAIHMLAVLALSDKKLKGLLVEFQGKTEMIKTNVKALLEQSKLLTTNIMTLEVIMMALNDKMRIYDEVKSTAAEQTRGLLSEMGVFNRTKAIEILEELIVSLKLENITDQDQKELQFTQLLITLRSQQAIKYKGLTENMIFLDPAGKLLIVSKLMEIFQALINQIPGQDESGKFELSIILHQYQRFGLFAVLLTQINVLLDGGKFSDDEKATLQGYSEQLKGYESDYSKGKLNQMLTPPITAESTAEQKAFQDFIGKLIQTDDEVSDETIEASTGAGSSHSLSEQAEQDPQVVAVAAVTPEEIQVVAQQAQLQSGPVIQVADKYNPERLLGDPYVYNKYLSSLSAAEKNILELCRILYEYSVNPLQLFGYIIHCCDFVYLSMNREDILDKYRQILVSKYQRELFPMKQCFYRLMQGEITPPKSSLTHGKQAAKLLAGKLIAKVATGSQGKVEQSLSEEPTFQILAQECYRNCSELMETFKDHKLATQDTYHIAGAEKITLHAISFESQTDSSYETPFFSEGTEQSKKSKVHMTGFSIVSRHWSSKNNTYSADGLLDQRPARFGIGLCVNGKDNYVLLKMDELGDTDSQDSRTSYQSDSLNDVITSNADIKREYLNKQRELEQAEEYAKTATMASVGSIALAGLGEIYSTIQNKKNEIEELVHRYDVKVKCVKVNPDTNCPDNTPVDVMLQWGPHEEIPLRRYKAAMDVCDRMNLMLDQLIDTKMSEKLKQEGGAYPRKRPILHYHVDERGILQYHEANAPCPICDNQLGMIKIKTDGNSYQIVENGDARITEDYPFDIAVTGKESVGKESKTTLGTYCVYEEQDQTKVSYETPVKKECLQLLYKFAATRIDKHENSFDSRGDGKNNVNVNGHNNDSWVKRATDLGKGAKKDNWWDNLRKLSELYPLQGISIDAKPAVIYATCMPFIDSMENALFRVFENVLQQFAENPNVKFTVSWTTGATAKKQWKDFFPSNVDSSHAFSCFDVDAVAKQIGEDCKFDSKKGKDGHLGPLFKAVATLYGKYESERDTLLRYFVFTYMSHYMCSLLLSPFLGESSEAAKRTLQLLDANSGLYMSDTPQINDMVRYVTDASSGIGTGYHSKLKELRTKTSDFNIQSIHRAAFICLKYFTQSPPIPGIEGIAICDAFLNHLNGLLSKKVVPGENPSNVALKDKKYTSQFYVEALREAKLEEKPMEKKSVLTTTYNKDDLATLSAMADMCAFCTNMLICPRKLADNQYYHFRTLGRRFINDKKDEKVTSFTQGIEGTFLTKPTPMWYTLWMNHSDASEVTEGQDSSVIRTRFLESVTCVNFERLYGKFSCSDDVTLLGDTSQMVIYDYQNDDTPIRLVDSPSVYHVIEDASVRLNPTDKGAIKDAVHKKGTEIRVTRESTTQEGMKYVFTDTPPEGWVKMKTSKGKILLKPKRTDIMYFDPSSPIVCDYLSDDLDSSQKQHQMMCTSGGCLRNGFISPNDMNKAMGQFIPG